VRKDKRRIQREGLAMAVRKHFNASAVNENDAVVNTLYKARTNGMLNMVHTMTRETLTMHRKIITIEVFARIEAVTMVVWCWSRAAEHPQPFPFMHNFPSIRSIGVGDISSILVLTL
jgi:hypothetical protein